MANWANNITNKPLGSYRSIIGYASEQAFIARAQKAGFNLFFKVWRDLEYDAVLDSEGVLFRIEVKSSSGKSFDLTRGARGGVQINKDVDKTRTITREDCDFVVCVDNTDFSCYILPVEVIELFNRNDLPISYLDTFKEKWDIFLGGKIHCDINQIKNGFSNLSENEIDNLVGQLRVPANKLIVPITPVGRSPEINDLRRLKLLRIWETLGS